MRIVEVKGKDAAEFLHRVTAGTVRGVEPGQGRAGCLLTGRSLVVATFELLHVESGLFYLVTPEGCATALADGLEALHFSESLEIRVTDLLVGIRECSGATRPADENFTVFRTGDELSWSSSVPGYGFATGVTGEPETWDYDRISHLVPSPKDWTAATPALEAGLLPMIDRHKGCYPGQEVVELSLNVGHPARVLISVGSGEPFKERIHWSGVEASVTSAAERDGRHAALVRVPWKLKDQIPPGLTLLKSHGW